jgi:hypothetical protein
MNIGGVRQRFLRETLMAPQPLQIDADPLLHVHADIGRSRHGRGP